MQKIKVNDEVLVIAGKNKGKTGKVIKVDKKNGRVAVENINLVKKNLKPTKENPNGGISEKESMIDISNVSLISPKTKKNSRVSFQVKDNKKVRVLVKCKTVL